MVFKLDMSKAYDQVEWTFLVAVLIKLDLNDLWIRVICDCLQTSHFSFVLNGCIKGLVIPSKWDQQGYHLSPNLFLLCAQGLSFLIR